MVNRALPQLKTTLLQSATSPAFTAFVTLTFLWALFFWRLLTPNPLDRVLLREGDFTQHYYAFSDYQAERLQSGQLPLWNPYNYAGDSFAGNIQFVTWYPPRWLAIALAGDGGWSLETYQLEVATHYWLVSLMAWAFLRLLVKRPAAALAGSVLYTYSGYLTGYPMLQVSVLESVAWLPLILLGVQWSLTKSERAVRGSLIAGAGTALSFLGGHPQTTVQLIYVALAYIAFAAYRRQIAWRGAALRAALLVGFGGGLAAVQLLPALEFTRLSARVNDLGYADKSNGFAVRELMQVMWPKLFGVWSPLYVGAAGLLLAAGALLRPKAAHYFWLGVIVVSLMLALGGNSIVYDFFYLFIPGMNIFRQQERAAALAVFALAALAVYQIDWLLDRTRSPNRSEPDERRFAWLASGHLALAFSAWIVVTIGGFFRSDGLADTSSALGFVALVSLLFTGWRLWQQVDSRLVVPAALVALVVFDLFTVNTRSTNFVPDLPENRVALPESLQAYQVAPQDIAGRVDGAAGLRGYGVYFRVPDIYGTGPFELESMARLRTIPVERFWEVLAVRYVTTADEPPAGVALELLAYDTSTVEGETQAFQVFELQDPRPMAHLVYDYREALGSMEFARQIMSDARVNLREMAVTLQPLPLELPGARPPDARVEGFRFVTPERIEMAVSSSENALLTIAMPSYPGWRARVNGAPVEIVDVYAGLIGIPITPGENQQVQLEFVPGSVIRGGILSALALAGAAVLALGEWVFYARRPDRRSALPAS